MQKKRKDTIGIRRYRMMLVVLLLAVILMFACYVFAAGQKNRRVKDATLVKKVTGKKEVSRERKA